MSSSPTIQQPPAIETAIRGDIMAVRIPKDFLPMHAEDSEDWFFFLDLAQVEELGLQTLDLTTLRTHKQLRRYFYFTGDQLKLLGEIGTENKWDYLYTFSQCNSLNILQQSDFDPNKLLYFYSDAHLFYLFRGVMPLSPVYRVGYIGGVDNKSYDLDTAEKILRANPCVSNLERMSIPYYNQEKGRTSSLEFTVRLPQDVYERAVTYYRDIQKEKFWTCRVKDSLASPYALEPLNILGLQAALKTKKKK